MSTIFWIVLIVWTLIFLGLGYWIYKATRRTLPIIVMALFLLVSAFLAYGNFFPSGIAAPTSDCTPATVVTEITNQVVYVDLRDGDRIMPSVVTVKPVLGGKNLIVVTDPGFAMDIIYQSMIFSSYKLEGSQAEVLCFVAQLPEAKDAVKVYIGNEIPNGYTSVEKAKGWWDSLTTRTYSTDEEDLDAGKAIPSFIPAGATKEMRTISPTGNEADYGQFWITTQPGQVVHYVVLSGYKFTIMAGYEGTNFHYATVAANFFDNVIQKTGYVVEQDHVWGVKLVLCGPATATDTILNSAYTTDAGLTVPVHAEWQTSLSGWACEKVGE